MDSLLNTFLAILSELESFEQECSEDPSLFTVNYSVPLPMIRIISKRFLEILM